MDLKSRLGSAPSNFSATLDAADSDLAQEARTPLIDAGDTPSDPARIEA